MGAADKAMHDYVCRTIFPRMGQIRSNAEVISSLY